MPLIGNHPASNKGFPAFRARFNQGFSLGYAAQRPDKVTGSNRALSKDRWCWEYIDIPGYRRIDSHSVCFLSSVYIRTLP